MAYKKRPAPMGAPQKSASDKRAQALPGRYTDLSSTNCAYSAQHRCEMSQRPSKPALSAFVSALQLVNQGTLMHTNSSPHTPPTLLRRAEVLSYFGFRPSKFHADIRRGLITRPVRLGSNTARWPDSEVSAILSARISGADDRQIRELVDALHASRAGVTQ